MSVEQWAEWLKAQLISQPARWAHVERVWKRSKDLKTEITHRWGETAACDFELAALLHDIGRVLDPSGSAPHAIVGAKYLSERGLGRVAKLVAHHSGAGEEAKIRGFAAEMTNWIPENSRLQALLTYLDSTTSHQGEIITLKQRRRSIAERYGEGSFQTTVFDSTEDEVKQGGKIFRVLWQKSLFASARRVKAVLE